MAERAPLLNLQALDTGDWGNRLRVSVQDEPAGTVPRTTVTSVIDATHIRLASAAGVEEGTILEVFNPADGAVVGDLLKVTDVNRAANFAITLDGAGISVAQSAPGLAVRSREFRLTVYLFRQPDLAMPSRNETVLDTEVFRYLSMDPRHSRYVQDIIGDINGPLRLSDRRPEGESWYIRVQRSKLTSTDIRLGPETLVDVLPDGRRRPARHRSGRPVRGTTRSARSPTTITSARTITDPEARTRPSEPAQHRGDQHRRVSGPQHGGDAERADQPLRADALPLRRARRPAAAAATRIADVQTQRQQFDTKYAALYHPWLLIPDPFPANLARSPTTRSRRRGHMVGVYARTDIERGVHKAPANEVVRGIIGLQRMLNKEQQDILNPYPVNINVIRDFRDNNRGIRVYGGRVITSDSGLEVRQRPAAADLHRGVDRPRPAVGGLRAERRAAVGARAPLDHQLPDPGLAQRRARRAPRSKRRSSSSATARR